ncbi:ProQ/FINO family protein [Variovorax sp. NFACC27]|uniref:ProQ/FINO family protein n=1 Tax=unclassified Variovorax TaxID=663243 RepID=UPI000894326C|nr:ProQ/FINO family protein [Variovorax sp. NFACC28]SEF62696.1 ProQ/FINO family protein [Variovorax sp. NFACC29]SFB73259.1 ProQ/FINO family protein [Variovorax sp. NFACC26]SFG56028.1 ProQ/FINO family protein [Variovorax sp. NFACC27]
MTEATTANPNNKSRRPRGERLDMAQQLQALRAGTEGSTTASEATAGTPSAPAQAKRPQQQHQQRKPKRPQQAQSQQQQSQQKQQPQQPARPQRKVHPALERLFELYPNLFGARFLPLKLGVYEELIARHPDDFKAEDLKVAMGLHARSTRYLESVAAGHPRHDLDGNVAEPVAPEHVHHAILELHRRRSQRTGEDLRPQLVARLARAVEASGLDREAYAVLVRSRDANNNAVLDEALAQLAEQAAKREALLRAFEASGRSEKEFADMYGMAQGEVARTLQRARTDRAAAAAAPVATTETPEAPAAPSAD